ncbi:DUF3067 family protein [Prochlorothrix hollandica]|uniref:DUF3067 family protein n=1 Tax=Prochlorothrix hollandica TaxID=1223 RepID=UPI00035EBEA4|nr:DUF3067 family protein [Prochlorothrix hollandica]
MTEPVPSDRPLTEPILTGAALKQLLLQKWGKAYDLRFRRVQGRIVLQVMWKYVGQVSFPMGGAQYDRHLETISTYLEALGGSQQVINFVTETRDRPRTGRAVTIPLAVELGERSSEWLLE